MLLIPAIDLRDGGCVRLFQGDFNAETRYSQAPLDLLARYRALGAPWLHVVDLDGAKDGALANRAIIVEMARERGMKLQVGGGVRSATVVEDLFCNRVARVVIGSAAIERPREVLRWLEQFGPDRICLAFDVRHDARGEPWPRTRGWTERSTLTLWQAIEPFLASGLKHVLCTDIERDGALGGPNIELYKNAVARFPQLDWQASGGVRNAADLQALAAVGVAAAISGKALLEERIDSKELRPFLPNASSPASTSATDR